MTVTLNFEPRPSPGYTPKKAFTLHNVQSVHDKGIRSVELHMIFTDRRPTYDHVVSVSVKPEEPE